jgi:hypothetical protein
MHKSEFTLDVHPNAGEIDRYVNSGGFSITTLSSKKWVATGQRHTVVETQKRVEVSEQPTTSVASLTSRSVAPALFRTAFSTMRRIATR